MRKLAPILAILVLLGAAPTAASAMTYETKGEQIAIGGEVPEGWKGKVVLAVATGASCPNALWNKDGGLSDGILSETRGGTEDIDGKNLEGSYTEGNSFWITLYLQPTTGTHAACLYQEVGIEECSGEGLYKECYYRYPLISELGTFSYINARQQKEEEEKKRDAEQKAKVEGEQQAREKAEAEKRAEAAAEAKASQESAERSTEHYLRGVAERGHCDELRNPTSTEKAFCSAVEAALAAEREAKENAVIAAARNRPLASLKVRARPTLEVPGDSGSTDLRIVAAPYANVTVKIARFGHRTERYELGEDAVINDRVRWSCGHPGGVFRYTVSARTDAGKTLVRKGSFRPLTTVAHCAKVKREREAFDRRFAAEVKRGEEERQREAAQHRREWEANCRAENGTPRTLNTGEGPERYCVAPNGGFLSVPEP
jgi:hypothetical protein